MARGQKPQGPESAIEIESSQDPLAQVQARLQPVFPEAPKPQGQLGHRPGVQDINFDDISKAFGQMSQKSAQPKQPVSQQEVEPEHQIRPTKPAIPSSKITGDQFAEQIVPSDLLADLERDFGFTKEQSHIITIYALGKSFELEVRQPAYEDWIWGQTVLLERLMTGKIQGMTPDQRTQVLNDHVNCKCVTKIKGIPVWEAFNTTQLIKAANPAWDETSVTGIPDPIQGALALRVFDFLKKLHPNVMFLLGSGMERLQATGSTVTPPDPNDTDLGEEDAEDLSQDPSLAT